VLGLARLVSIIDSQNAASNRVAEKLGMHCEQDLLFGGRNQRLYALRLAGGA
jgi:RimJ/RimL family protein N-acetyltransferase